MKYLRHEAEDGVKKGTAPKKVTLRSVLLSWLVPRPGCNAASPLAAWYWFGLARRGMTLEPSVLKQNARGRSVNADTAVIAGLALYLGRKSREQIELPRTSFGATNQLTEKQIGAAASGCVSDFSGQDIRNLLSRALLSLWLLGDSFLKRWFRAWKTPDCR